MEISEAWWAVKVSAFWIATHQRGIFDIKGRLFARDGACMVSKYISDGGKKGFEIRNVVEISGSRTRIISIDNPSLLEAAAPI